MTDIDKSKSPEMFDGISSKYDLTNKIISLGVDRNWRQKLARLVAKKPGSDVLDLATGTGDVIVDLLRIAKPRRIVGIDPAEGMLEVARKKIKGDISELQAGDAQDLNLENDSFDFATIAFGIRNIPDPQKALNEMFRVLKPGGEALVLEFSLPENRMIRSGFLFYLRNLLPKLGAMITGDLPAYLYLDQTIESFPCGKEFGKLLEKAGFSDVTYHKLTFGIATIYQAKKL